MIWSIRYLSFFSFFLQGRIQSTVFATNIEADNIYASSWEEHSKLQDDYNMSIHQLIESLLEKHREYLAAHEIYPSANELNDRTKFDDANGKDIEVSTKRTENQPSSDSKFHLIPVSKKTVERAEGNLRQNYPYLEGLSSIVPWEENMEAILIVYNNG